MSGDFPDLGTAGLAVKHSITHACPHCGYCPHCGRSAQPVYPYYVPIPPPYLPVNPYWTPWPYPIITC